MVDDNMDASVVIGGEDKAADASADTESKPMKSGDEKSVDDTAKATDSTAASSNGADATKADKQAPHDTDLSKVPLQTYMTHRPSPTIADPTTLTDTTSTPLPSEKLTSFHDAATKRNAVCILLAAGQGSRFISDTPKVIHPLHDQPLAQYSLDAATRAGLPVVVVVGHARQQVVKTLRVANDASVVYVCQEERLGTGHAVYVATTALPADYDGDIVISYADNPGVDDALLSELLRAHGEFAKKYGDSYGAMVVTGSRKEAGDGAAAYGRIVRKEKDGNGSVVDIVEKKTITKLGEDGESRRYGDVEWSAKELEDIDEFNSGIVVARGKAYLEVLREVLGSRTKTEPVVKYEYYATDFVKGLVGKGRVAEGFVVKGADIWKVEGANTVEELKELAVKMGKSKNEAEQNKSEP